MGAEDKKVIDEKIEQSEKERKKEEKKKRREQRKKDRVSFFADFKKFITKGNVLDMAVGVVIGSAFTAIVNGLVKNIINPCIARITGSSDMSEWKTIIQKEVVEGDTVVTPEIAILWGDWLQTIINFFIIAFSVFVAVRVIKKAERMMNAREIEKQEAEAAKKKAEEEAKAAAAKEIADQKAAEEKAILDEYYANIREQSQLLREIKESLNQK